MTLVPLVSLVVDPIRRRALVATALLAAGAALAGCGFHPLYGETASRAFDPELAAIKVDPIPERLGQLTAISLRDGLNPEDARVEYKYRLIVALQSQLADFAIRKDGTASRQLYNVMASYRLAPMGAGATIFSGSARFNTSFDVGDNEYATIVAGQDAEERAAREISEQIRTQLMLFLQRRTAHS